MQKKRNSGMEVGIMDISCPNRSMEFQKRTLCRNSFMESGEIGKVAWARRYGKVFVLDHEKPTLKKTCY